MAKVKPKRNIFVHRTKETHMLMSNRLNNQEMEAPSFGDRLKEVRRLLRLTQEDLAERAGVQRSHIAKIESGEIGQPNSETIHKLAKALDMDPDMLNTRGPSLASDRFVSMLERLNRADRESIYQLMTEIMRRIATAKAREYVIAQPGPSEIADRPLEEKYLPFDIPPEEFVEGDWDYMQTYRGGPADLMGAAAAGEFEDIDTTGETAEVLNPTLRDIQSGRYGVVRVKGKSMEPRLHDGDLVLVDTYDKTPGPRRIMAVYRKKSGKERGGSAFGYIHKVGDSTFLTKFNPEFPPIPLTDRDIIRGVVKKRLAEDLE